MKTRTDNIIQTGIKENSMYQHNAVMCDATIKEIINIMKK